MGHVAAAAHARALVTRIDLFLRCCDPQLVRLPEYASDGNYEQ